jgi:hypothetical protein
MKRREEKERKEVLSISISIIVSISIDDIDIVSKKGRKDVDRSMDSVVEREREMYKL